LSSFPHQRILESDYRPVFLPRIQAKQSFVDLKDKQRIAIQTWGKEDADVKIMCLHGWLDNSNTWNTFIPLLLEKSPVPLHIVAVDFAGHGWSSHRPPSSFYRLIQHALDCFNVASEIGWEEFTLLGHSMGGVVCTLMASLVPERINRTVSVDTCGPYVYIRPGTSYGDFLAKDFIRAPQLWNRQPRVYASFEALFERYRKNNMNLLEESAHLIVSRGVERVRIDDEVGEDLQQPSLQEKQTNSGQYGYCFRHDPRCVGGKMDLFTEEMVASLFQRMRKPIMFVLASRKARPQFHFIVELVKKRRNYLQNCECEIVVADGEHHIHLDHPERIMPSILEFLSPLFYAPPPTKAKL